MKVAGFVLTGGSSRRMGRDKALLPVGGQTMCEHLGEVVASVAEKVLLVGHPERYTGLKYGCVADIHPDRGPLSGLETALMLDLAEYSIMVSCDSANLSSGWLIALLAQAEASGELCVVAEDSESRLQPLCGIYRRDCRPIVARALQEGRLRMLDLLRELDAKPVKVQDRILNLNTPEQFEEMGYAGRGK